jgi:hypothetical protein
MRKYEFPSKPMRFKENPLNPTGFGPGEVPASSGLPPAVQALLERFVKLAREVEPYLHNEAGDSVYIDFRQGSWTATMLEQLRREIYLYPAAVGLLQYAAEHPGVEVTYRDFLQQSSWTDTQIRSELGAVSKVSRKLFGSKVWPLRTRQGKDGVMRYFMPEPIAEWWTRGGVSSRSA